MPALEHLRAAGRGARAGRDARQRRRRVVRDVVGGGDKLLPVERQLEREDLRAGDEPRARDLPSGRVRHTALRSILRLLLFVRLSELTVELTHLQVVDPVVV